MHYVWHYRKEAAACRTLASKQCNPEVKAGLLQLANQWDALADQRMRWLELQEEFNVLQTFQDDQGTCG